MKAYFNEAVATFNCHLMGIFQFLLGERKVTELQL